jgi:HEAT repeat protein
MATLSKLQSMLTRPRVELRRSAALTLGEVDNPLALQPLRTAYEMEAEPLAREFALISIGRQGGFEARDMLLGVLGSGDKASRPWCALALGLVARGMQDNEVRAAVRKASAQTKTSEERGAYWIAAGLLQDSEAVPGIIEGLQSTGDPRQRVYAATALGMIADQASVTTLRQRIHKEDSDTVRVAIALALATLGRSEDAPLMIETFRAFANPEMQTLAAGAMGFHGTPESLRCLLELAAADDGSALTTTAAIESIGLMLSRSTPYSLADASRQSNYTNFSDWVVNLFQKSL